MNNVMVLVLKNCININMLLCLPQVEYY